MYEFASPDGSVELSFSLFNNETSGDEDECNQLYNGNTRFVFLAIYSLLTVVSVFGNSLILCVILRRRRMRTVTNYFIANITITNLIYTACEPFNIVIEMYSCWIFFSFTCPFLTILNTLSINVNTFTMIAASIDRLIVIKYPLKTKLTKNQAINIIGAIWILGVFISFPWAFLLRPAQSVAHYVEEIVSTYMSKILELNSTLTNLTYDNNEAAHVIDPPLPLYDTSSPSYYHIPVGDYIGKEDSDSPIHEDSYEIGYGFKQRFPTCELINVGYVRYYTMFLMWIQFVLPLLILISTYLIIAYYIYVPHSEIISRRSRNGLLDRKKKKSIKMLVLTIVGFNVCWFPLQTIVLLDWIKPQYLADLLGNLNDLTWPITHLLAFSHFCHNPFVNGLLNKKLKTEITSLFRYMYIAAKQFVLKIACCLVKRNETGQLVFYKGSPRNFNLDADQQMMEERHSSEILKKGHLKIRTDPGALVVAQQANYATENQITETRVVGGVDKFLNYRQSSKQASNLRVKENQAMLGLRKKFWTRSTSPSGARHNRSESKSQQQQIGSDLLAESYEREMFLADDVMRHQSLKFHANTSSFKLATDLSSLNAAKVSSSSSTSKSTSSNNTGCQSSCTAGYFGVGATTSNDLKRLKYMCSSHKLMFSLSQRVSSLESLCKMNKSHRHQAIRKENSFNGSGKKVVFRFANAKNDDLKIKEVFYSAYEKEPVCMSNRGGVVENNASSPVQASDTNNEQLYIPVTASATTAVGSLVEFNSSSKSSQPQTTFSRSSNSSTTTTTAVSNVKKMSHKLLSYDLLFSLNNRSTRSFSIPPVSKNIAL